MVTYVGEIKMFAGPVAPPGFAFCDGQQILIEQNISLYNVIGCIYGGDGETYFCLPDLRQRVAIHCGRVDGTGSLRELGQGGGSARVALTEAQMGQHSHVSQGTPVTGETSPIGHLWGTLPAGRSGAMPAYYYSTTAPTVPMHDGVLEAMGDGGAHNNLSPILVVNYIIAVSGIFPRH
jgi:microcystin-dependent protein